MTIHISKHAFDRADERMSLRPDSFERLAIKAWEEGKQHSELKGTIKKYVDGIYLQYNNANSVRLFGEFVFLFAANQKTDKTTLITVYQIPVKLKRYLKSK